MLAVRLRHGHDGGSGRGALGKIRWWLAPDVVAVRGEGERNAEPLRPFPRRGGWLGGEMGVEKLRLELPENLLEQSRVVASQRVESGFRDDVVTEFIHRLAQGEDAQ